MNNNEIFFIAEAGINHNGEIDNAYKLIDIAKSANCDSIKFQKRDIDICIPAHQKNVEKDTPWGKMTYYEYKKRIEFGKNQYLAIDSYCKEVGISWSASAWDTNSLNFLEDFDVPYHKIPSALNTNLEFVKAVKEKGRSTICSTGMATIEQIDRVVEIFKDSKNKLTLMHTVSTYPTQDRDLNLRMIQTLSTRYNVPVGYSGHEASVSPTIVAAALGAKVIERHITIDRSMWGTDQSASLEPQGLSMLVGALKKLPESLGTGIKTFSDEERAIAKKMRYWENGE